MKTDPNDHDRVHANVELWGPRGQAVTERVLTQDDGDVEVLEEIREHIVGLYEGGFIRGMRVVWSEIRQEAFKDGATIEEIRAALDEIAFEHGFRPEPVEGAAAAEAG